MSANVEAFDAWIRSTFVELNTELEELYFAREDRANVEGVGDDLKQRILEEGRVFVRALAEEGNTDEGFDQAFDVLGDLGLYMASLRRHELTNPAREQRSPHEEATALGLHIGASVGVVPRFATSHLATHNLARDGRQKSFTRSTSRRGRVGDRASVLMRRPGRRRAFSTGVSTPTNAPHAELANDGNCSPA